MRELPPQGTSPRDYTTAINQLIRGRSNAAIAVVLKPNSTSTTVSNANINVDTVPVLSPASSSAAASVATTFATVPTAGVILITHTSSSATDRKFSLLMLGG